MVSFELPLSVLLRDESARATSDVTPPLRPHQEAALARCLAIETGTLDIGIIRDLTPDHEYADLRSRIGAICDATGSGKSLVAIALCAAGSEVPPPVRSMSHCDGMVSYSVCATDHRRVRTSVIVVPHGVLQQWAQYVRDSGVSHVAVITQTARARRDLELALNGDSPPAIVLCSETNYRTVNGVFSSNGLCADRLIIDEADTIPLGHTELLTACMYWTLTASLPSMLNPAGGFYATHDGDWAVYGRVRSMVVRRMWRALEACSGETRAMLVVRCSDEFVSSSLSLVPYEERSVLCRAPAGTAVLSGLVDRSVMQALDTDDTALALSLLPNRDSADNIVANVRAGWQQAISEARANIASLAGVPGRHAEDFVRSMEREVHTHTKSIEALDERVRGQQNCAICYDDASVGRTLLTCCSSVYCVKCVATWLNKHSTCPNCRAHTSFDDAMIVGEESSSDKSQMLQKTESVVKLVKAMLAADPERRVILACSNMGLGKTLQRPFAVHGIAALKGTGASIAKTVRAFRDGSVRVLFMSEDCYCTGINLPFATDVVLFHRTSASMEDQIIGRAQRPGRSCTLRVWRMVHAGEGGANSAAPLATALAAA